MFPVEEYRQIIKDFRTLMNEKSEIGDVRAAPEKWTLKEMAAHLIDSASNNHQRMIRLQYEKRLVFPAYEAEQWREITGIGSYSYAELVRFWESYNLYLLHIIEKMDSAALQNVWLKDDLQITLEELVIDYFRHILTHKKMFEERAQEIGKLRQ